MTDGPPLFLKGVHRVEWRLRDAVLIHAIPAILAILIVLAAPPIPVAATKLSTKRKKTVTIAVDVPTPTFPLTFQSLVGVLGNAGSSFPHFFMAASVRTARGQTKAMFVGSWLCPINDSTRKIILISLSSRSTSRYMRCQHTQLYPGIDGILRPSTRQIVISILFVILPFWQDGIVSFLLRISLCIFRFPIFILPLAHVLLLVSCPVFTM